MVSIHLKMNIVIQTRVFIILFAELRPWNEIPHRRRSFVARLSGEFITQQLTFSDDPALYVQ